MSTMHPLVLLYTLLKTDGRLGRLLEGKPDGESGPPRGIGKDVTGPKTKIKSCLEPTIPGVDQERNQVQMGNRENRST